MRSSSEESSKFVDGFGIEFLYDCYGRVVAVGGRNPSILDRPGRRSLENFDLKLKIGNRKSRVLKLWNRR